MRFRLLKGLAVALFLVVFSGFNGVAWGDAIEIQVNNTMKPGGSEEVAVKAFAEYLESKAPGRFKVVPFLSGQLGGENTVLELLNIGETQISLTATNWRTQYAPEYDAISIPFLFPTSKAIEAYMSTDSGKKLIEAGLKKGGFVHLGIQNRAPRNTTANKAIHTPEDLAGFKLRLPAVPIWVDVWKALGAQPVVVPAPEIYLAIQTGQVDGQENPLSSPYNRKLYEVQTHLVMTSHIIQPWHWVASNVFWQKLSPSDRQLVQDAVNFAREKGNAAEEVKDKFYLEELIKKGMIVIEPDREKFIKKAQLTIDKAVSEMAPGVAEDVKKAINSSR
jgi:tripartite ATP-independent transporter DctP family solute receptor